MFNFTLYRREMSGVWKMLVIFAAVLAMYISIIISMYDPDMQDTLNQMIAMMPGLMDAMGFKLESAGLVGFIASYLYGFIMILFPMVFSILCGNRLIARYVDSGSMVCLLAAPVKRRTVAFTQMKVIATGIIALVLFATVLEWVLCVVSFPGELEAAKLLLLNLGVLCTHLFIGGLCFFCSCLFSDVRRSIGFGAGIPALMFILQVLANVGGTAEKAKYFTFLTLFDTQGLLSGERAAIAGITVLFAGAVVLFAGAIAVFTQKDLSI